MGHLRVLSLKLLFNGLPLFLILTFAGGLNWLNSIIISLAIVILAYVLGDIFVLPAFGNLVATLADGGLVFLLLYMLRYVGMALHIPTILFCALVVVMVEGLIYHSYLKRMVTFDSMEPKIGNKD